MHRGRIHTAAVLEPGTASPGAVVDGISRPRLWRALTIAAGLGLAALGFVFLQLQVSVPSSGTHVRPGAPLVVGGGTPLSPLGESNLREGDVLVAIDGIPIEALAQDLVPLTPGPTMASERRSQALDVRIERLRARWAAGESVTFDIMREDSRLAVDVRLGRHPVLAAALRTWGTILFALVTSVVAILVFLRRPDHPPARVLFVSAGALVAATAWSLGLRPADLVQPAGFWLFQATTVAAFMIYWTSLFHFALVFPRRLRIAAVPGVVPALYALPFAIVGAYLAVRAARSDSVWTWMSGLAPVTGPHAAVFLGATLATVAWQFATTRSTTQRRQIRWVVLAGLVTGLAGLFLYILPPLIGAAAVSANLIGVVVTAFPLGIAVAVLRDRLFDIDTLLQRAIVYGLLTFLVAGVYVVFVALAGAVLPAQAGRTPALLATLAAAIAFQPLRDRLQRWVNRWLYGDRDDPAAVLTQLGARLERTLAHEDILPTLVQTVAQALKLPYVAIHVGPSAHERIEAEYGRPSRESEHYPLTYRGHALGAMLIEPRGDEEPFTTSERTLLGTIARQASVAAYAVQATSDLRRSRERLVAAREEERRRLRRDLHDGLGPALAALSLKLDAASNVVGKDATAARRLIDDLGGQVQSAVDDLRRIVHALRPPVLDDLGLAGALREAVRRWDGGGLDIALETPESLPSIPAATELAAYRIVHEALANVVRHAGASRCRVVVRAGAWLDVVIEDNGCGMAMPASTGVGLASMRARAEELGGMFRIEPAPAGGTRIRARLPLADVETSM